MTGKMRLIERGLAGRLRSLVLAIDRLDRLESGTGKWLGRFPGDELAEAAGELTLRAFRTAADPINYRVLLALESQATLAVSELLEKTSLSRLPLSERLNDLVQVGLAARMIDTDHAQITEAGAEMTRMLRAAILGVAREYAEIG